MKSHFVLGRVVLRNCISWYIHQIKPIREKFTNHLKPHNLQNLVLITEAEKPIWIYSGVSSVYTFSHAYFEGICFHVAMCYVRLKK